MSIINGTILVTDTRHDDALVYITIEGNDPDRPLIIAFDRDDLDAIAAAYETLKQGPQPCGCPGCGGAQRYNVRRITDPGADSLAAADLREPEPDPGAILQILSASRSGHFVHDRVEYRFDDDRGEWVAWGRTDIDDQDGAW